MLISIAASPILRRLREVFDMQVVSGPVPGMASLDVSHLLLRLRPLRAHGRGGCVRLRVWLHVSFRILCVQGIFGSAA